MNAKQIVENHLKTTGESIQSFVDRAGVGRSSYYDLMMDRHQLTVPVLSRILAACGQELTLKPISTAETPSERKEVKHGNN